MKNDGASLSDIQYFLRVLADPPIKAERSTIKRYIDSAESTHG